MDRASINTQILALGFVAKVSPRSHKKIGHIAFVFLCLWAATTLTRDQLSSLNSSISQLRSSLDPIQARVAAVRTRINSTLSNPLCVGCDELCPELQNLKLDTTISVSPDFCCTYHVNQINLWRNINTSNIIFVMTTVYKTPTRSRHILDDLARLLPPAVRSKYFALVYLHVIWSQWSRWSLLALSYPLPPSRAQSPDLTAFQDALDKVISSNLTSTIKEVSINHTEPFFPSLCDRKSTHSHANPESYHNFNFFFLF